MKRYLDKESIKIIGVSICLAFVIVISTTEITFAKESPPSRANYCTADSKSVSFFPTWYKFLPVSYDNDKDACIITGELADNLPKIALGVVEILLRVAGILGVVFVTYGGFQYLTSTGEPEKVKGARTTIINALVGVMIAMLATVVVNIIGNNI